MWEEYDIEGTNKDFDKYAIEVMNGDGYYDEEGKFHWYKTDEWGEL